MTEQHNISSFKDQINEKGFPSSISVLSPNSNCKQTSFAETKDQTITSGFNLDKSSVSNNRGAPHSNQDLTIDTESQQVSVRRTIGSQIVHTQRTLHESVTNRRRQQQVCQALAQPPHAKVQLRPSAVQVTTKPIIINRRYQSVMPAALQIQQQTRTPKAVLSNTFGYKSSTKGGSLSKNVDESQPRKQHMSRTIVVEQGPPRHVSARNAGQFNATYSRTKSASRANQNSNSHTGQQHRYSSVTSGSRARFLREKLVPKKDYERIRVAEPRSLNQPKFVERRQAWQSTSKPEEDNTDTVQKDHQPDQNLEKAMLDKALSTLNNQETQKQASAPATKRDQSAIRVRTVQSKMFNDGTKGLKRPQTTRNQNIGKISSKEISGDTGFFSPNNQEQDVESTTFLHSSPEPQIDLQKTVKVDQMLLEHFLRHAQQNQDFQPFFSQNTIQNLTINTNSAGGIIKQSQISKPEVQNNNGGSHHLDPNSFKNPSEVLLDQKKSPKGLETPQSPSFYRQKSLRSNCSCKHHHSQSHHSQRSLRASKRKRSADPRSYNRSGKHNHHFDHDPNNPFVELLSHLKGKLQEQLNDAQHILKDEYQKMFEDAIGTIFKQQPLENITKEQMKSITSDLKRVASSPEQQQKFKIQMIPQTNSNMKILDHVDHSSNEGQFSDNVDNSVQKPMAFADRQLLVVAEEQESKEEPRNSNQLVDINAEMIRQASKTQIVQDTSQRSSQQLQQQQMEFIQPQQIIKNQEQLSPIIPEQQQNTIINNNQKQDKQIQNNQNEKQSLIKDENNDQAVDHESQQPIRQSNISSRMSKKSAVNDVPQKQEEMSFNLKDQKIDLCNQQVVDSGQQDQQVNEVLVSNNSQLAIQKMESEQIQPPTRMMDDSQKIIQVHNNNRSENLNNNNVNESSLTISKSSTAKNVLTPQTSNKQSKKSSLRQSCDNNTQSVKQMEDETEQVNDIVQSATQDDQPNDPEPDQTEDISQTLIDAAAVAATQQVKQQTNNIDNAAFNSFDKSSIKTDINKVKFAVENESNKSVKRIQLNKEVIIFDTKEEEVNNTNIVKQEEVQEQKEDNVSVAVVSSEQKSKVALRTRTLRSTRSIVIGQQSKIQQKRIIRKTRSGIVQKQLQEMPKKPDNQNLFMSLLDEFSDQNKQFNYMPEQPSVDENTSEDNYQEFCKHNKFRYYIRGVGDNNNNSKRGSSKNKVVVLKFEDANKELISKLDYQANHEQIGKQCTEIKNAFRQSPADFTSDENLQDQCVKINEEITTTIVIDQENFFDWSEDAQFSKQNARKKMPSNKQSSSHLAQFGNLIITQNRQKKEIEDIDNQLKEQSDNFESKTYMMRSTNQALIEKVKSVPAQTVINRMHEIDHCDNYEQLFRLHKDEDNVSLESKILKAKKLWQLDTKNEETLISQKQIMQMGQSMQYSPPQNQMIGVKKALRQQMKKLRSENNISPQQGKTSLLSQNLFQYVTQEFFPRRFSYTGAHLLNLNSIVEKKEKKFMYKFMDPDKTHALELDQVRLLRADRKTNNERLTDFIFKSEKENKLRLKMHDNDLDFELQFLIIKALNMATNLYLESQPLESGESDGQNNKSCLSESSYDASSPSRVKYDELSMSSSESSSFISDYDSEEDKGSSQEAEEKAKLESEFLRVDTIAQQHQVENESKLKTRKRKSKMSANTKKSEKASQLFSNVQILVSDDSKTEQHQLKSGFFWSNFLVKSRFGLKCKFEIFKAVNDPSVVQKIKNKRKKLQKQYSKQTVLSVTNGHVDSALTAIDEKEDEFSLNKVEVKTDNQENGDEVASQISLQTDNSMRMIENDRNMIDEQAIKMNKEFTGDMRQYVRDVKSQAARQQINAHAQTRIYLQSTLVTNAQYYQNMINKRKEESEVDSPLKMGQVCEAQEINQMDLDDEEYTYNYWTFKRKQIVDVTLNQIYKEIEMDQRLEKSAQKTKKLKGKMKRLEFSKRAPSMIINPNNVLSRNSSKLKKFNRQASMLSQKNFTNEEEKEELKSISSKSDKNNKQFAFQNRKMESGIIKSMKSSKFVPVSPGHRSGIIDKLSDRLSCGDNISHEESFFSTEDNLDMQPEKEQNKKVKFSRDLLQTSILRKLSMTQMKMTPEWQMRAMKKFKELIDSRKQRGRTKYVVKSKKKKIIQQLKIIEQQQAAKRLIKLLKRGNKEDMRFIKEKIDENPEIGWIPKIKDERGDNMLDIAVKLGNNEIVHYLMKKGVDPNIKDHDGNPPLANAQSLKYGRTAQVLLECGANELQENAQGLATWEVASKFQH